MDKYIKDKYGRILGKITEEGGGNQSIRDPYGRLLGTYNASQDVTRDYRGQLVAYGNILPCFLNINPYSI